MIRNISLFTLLLIASVGCQPTANSTTNLIIDQESQSVDEFEIDEVEEEKTGSNESNSANNLLPDYIARILPEHNGQYSLSEYEQLAKNTSWGINSAGICISVEAAPLMEPGDFLTAKEFIDRISIRIDDSLIAEPSSILHFEIAGIEKRDPVSDEIVWKAPDGFPAGICYEKELSIGQHFGEVLIQRSSGEEVKYNWSFVITE